MNKKLSTPIAAVLLLITSILSIFGFILDILNYGLSVALSGSFFFFLLLAIDLALCFTLFGKKRNNILIIVLGCEAVAELLLLLQYFSLSNLLAFAAYAVLLVYAISTCEQTLIKADLSAVKELSGKLFFLPAVLYLASYAIHMINVGFFVFTFITDIISNLLNAFALFSIAQWLNDPYAKGGSVSSESGNEAYVEEEYEEAYCGLGKHIVLCLFTFGIWPLIWTYRTTKYLNKAPNATYYNPTTKLLLCMFIPFYQIYWFYKHGQRLDAMSKQKQLNNSDMATLCLILGIFIPIVACILMQDRVNTLCTTKAVKEMPKAEDDTAEQLKKYKDLLDSGMISQEDYDAKKKQLLGL